jgi:tetratricopeptide (TPR) repeat protein
MGKGRASKGKAAAWGCLVCATLMAYFPALGGGLLWDDNKHVTRPELQSLAGLGRIWSDPHATQQYYPLLHTVFWIEHRLWGDKVLGYHLANVALHAASACLVVLIVKRLALPGAWLAGFVFALHPVCVEAVAWISEQKSTLSGVFYLGSALAYLHFMRTRRRPQYLLASGLFVLALLSKTVTATLPAALLVVIWWQHGRLEWKRDIRPLLPWLVVGACAGLFTAWVEVVFIGAQGADFKLTPVGHVLLAGRVIWFYAGKLVWPADLQFTYPRWSIDPGVWWQYLFPLSVLAAAAGLVWLARRRRGPLAGFLIFAGTLFPVLGFLNVYPFRYSYVADHFQYLASLGLIVPAASALSVAAARVSPGKAGPLALAVLPLLVFGVLTWRQSGMYRDAETLYRKTLERNPDSWMAHNNLGDLLSQIPGRLPEAITEFEAAVRLKPDLADTHANLASVLSRVPGRLAEAAAECAAALHIRPDFAPAHNTLGSIWSQIPGRLPDAVAEFQLALRWKPDYAEAHYNLGNALAQIPGRLPEAIAEYQAALRLKPLAEAHHNLGVVLAQIPGRQPEAMGEFEAALRIRPDLEPARRMLERLRRPDVGLRNDHRGAAGAGRDGPPK